MNTTTYHTSAPGISAGSGMQLSEISGRFESLGAHLNKLDSTLEVLLGRIDPVLAPVNCTSGGGQDPTPGLVESEVSARISNLCNYVAQIINRVEDANSRLAL